MIVARLNVPYFRQRRKNDPEHFLFHVPTPDTHPHPPVLKVPDRLLTSDVPTFISPRFLRVLYAIFQMSTTSFRIEVRIHEDCRVESSYLQRPTDSSARVWRPGPKRFSSPRKRAISVTGAFP